MEVEICGTVAPGFEKVRETFAANWDDIEVGASYSVVYRGETVVDIWGGWQDRDCSRKWEEDTSSTPAACMALIRTHSDTAAPAGPPDLPIRKTVLVSDTP